jgi:hypothetical protein
VITYLAIRYEWNFISNLNPRLTINTCSSLGNPKSYPFVWKCHIFSKLNSFYSSIILSFPSFTCVAFWHLIFYHFWSFRRSLNYSSYPLNSAGNIPLAMWRRNAPLSAQPEKTTYTPSIRFSNVKRSFRL